MDIQAFIDSIFKRQMPLTKSQTDHELQMPKSFPDTSNEAYDPNRNEIPEEYKELFAHIPDDPKSETQNVDALISQLLKQFQQNNYNNPFVLDEGRIRKQARRGE